MHQLEFQLDRIKDMPDSSYWQMLETMAELRQREVAAARAYDEGLRELKKDHLARLNALLGEDGGKKLDKYLAFRKAHSARLRAARRSVTLGKVSHEKFDEIRQRLVEKSKIFIQELGVGPAQTKSLHELLEKQREKLFNNTVGKGESVAERPRKKAKNTTFTPPYDGWMQEVSTSTQTDGPTHNLPSPTTALVTQAPTGAVGSYSNIRLLDGSAYDSAEVICRAGVLKSYRMPDLGQVRVSCKLEVIDNFFLGHIDNEAGWSLADVYQSTDFYAQVVAPNLTGRRTWGLPHYRYCHILNMDTDDSWPLQGWVTGQVISLQQLVLPGVFPKGTLVTVNVGVAHRNKFFSWRYGVWSNHGAQFWIKQIGISSSGP